MNLIGGNTARLVNTVYAAAFCLLAATGLSACSLDEPSNVNTSRVEVHSREHAYKIPLDKVNQEEIEKIANHYYRFSNGPARVTVTYDPVSQGGSAMKSSFEAARIAKELRKAGVVEIQTDILPVSGEAAPQVLVTYEEISAHKPENCGTLPGADGPVADTGKLDGYKFGCSIETNFAKQIQRPRDLLGQKPGALTDGRRAVNINSPYHSGVPNNPLKGEQASSD